MSRLKCLRISHIHFFSYDFEISLYGRAANGAATTTYLNLNKMWINNLAAETNEAACRSIESVENPNNENEKKII